MPEVQVSVPVIDRVISLQPARPLSVGDYVYIDKDKEVSMFQPPILSPLRVASLTGFVDLLQASFESFDHSNVMVHVVSHEDVRLVSRQSDSFGRRLVFIEATAMKAERLFKFNEFTAVEAFNIGLRALFVQTEELDALVALAGNIVSDNSVQLQDDGFAQKVTAKTGVGPLVGDRVVNPRVALKPYRTFREVEQPSSDYILRVRTGEQGVACALFEADGGVWKMTAMKTVKDWLTNQLRGNDQFGLGDIPVIA